MRVEKTIKNLVYGYVFKIISLSLNFIVRIVFVKFLSIEFLGASGLFSNILGVLSFAELGIGSAITFCLYKPLEENDKEKIRTLMTLFKRCYHVIALIVIVSGLCCVPFLDILTSHSTLPNLTLIYILYLLDTVISYFGADKQSLLMADQKRYLVTRNTTIIQFVKSIFQIIFIVVSKNFLIYLTVQVICQIFTVLYLRITANREYPYLRDNTVIKPLSNEENRGIITNVKALVLHKIGGILVNNTDNIIISSFLGLATTGIASNFTMIISAVNTILLQLSYATLASVGNLIASDVDDDYRKKVFNRLDFLNYALYMICTIFLATLMKPLIEVLGKEYGLGDSIVLILCANFMLSGSRQVVNQFKETAGLFTHDKYKSICEAIVNLVISLILVKPLGLLGVYIGTFACSIIAGAWWEQLVTFNYLFHESFIKYNLRWIGRLMFTISVSGLLIFIRDYFSLTGFIGFIEMFLIDLILIIFLFLLLYRRTDEFKYFLQFINKIIKRKA